MIISIYFVFLQNKTYLWGKNYGRGIDSKEYCEIILKWLLMIIWGVFLLILAGVPVHMNEIMEMVALNTKISLLFFQIKK